MKLKQLILLTPISLLALTACSISFSGEEHETGPGNGSDNNGQTIEYFEGDDIDVAGKTMYVISMANTLSQEKQLSTGAEYLPYLTYDDSIFSGVADEEKMVIKESQKEYASLDQGGFRLGSVIHNVDGCVTFNFASTIAVSAVKISARPRSALKMNEEVQTVIDNPVSLSVNNSKYITINSNFDDIENVTGTDCKYAFETATNKVSINVIGERAIIDTVSIYC